jgi:hypothetical protein
MSRARKDERDFQREREQGDPKPPTEYTFHLQTPHGMRSVTIPAAGMKVCPCGNDLFEPAYRVTHVRPAGLVGVEPICLRVEVYVCKLCKRELSPTDPSKAEAEARGEPNRARIKV